MFRWRRDCVKKWWSRLRTFLQGHKWNDSFTLSNFLMTVHWLKFDVYPSALHRRIAHRIQSHVETSWLVRLYDIHSWVFHIEWCLLSQVKPNEVLPRNLEAWLPSPKKFCELVSCSALSSCPSLGKLLRKTLQWKPRSPQQIILQLRYKFFFTLEAVSHAIWYL